MLSKIRQLKNLKELSKNKQRTIGGGYNEDPCGETPYWYQPDCPSGRTYALCADPFGQMACDPCVMCVNF
ncbi:hypothetical protein C8N46_106270 [Kordia periserrulae]|uniref:Uncharacterized protein n=1 Tax=Kordia periserrulae TaxID=701523 RepID=A0A2T6BX24_9FLAO|nr:hypothetical protein [Kordia periserrulae]PTX60624.1 hypothetical protein C8N46_106270 [Kordia periserrulae]